MRLYPKVKVIGQSFAGVKETAIPSQSMSLKEIIRRFVRRESLPIEKDGIYEERMGDLEKLANADITEKMERVEQLKSTIKKATKSYEEKNQSKKVTPESGKTTPTTEVEKDLSQSGSGTPVNS